MRSPRALLAGAVVSASAVGAGWFALRYSAQRTSPPASTSVPIETSASTDMTSDVSPRPDVPETVVSQVADADEPHTEAEDQAERIAAEARRALWHHDLSAAESFIAQLKTQHAETESSQVLRRFSSYGEQAEWL